MISDRYRQKNMKMQMTKKNKVINNRRLLNYFKKQQ